MTVGRCFMLTVLPPCRSSCFSCQTRSMALESPHPTTPSRGSNRHKVPLHTFHRTVDVPSPLSRSVMAFGGPSSLLASPASYYNSAADAIRMENAIKERIEEQAGHWRAALQALEDTRSRDRVCYSCVPSMNVAEYVLVWCGWWFGCCPPAPKSECIECH